jgi:hypothetical protein
MAAVLVAGTGQAHAATVRYAGPNGSGDTCSAPDPCALDDAVNNAPASSEVVVLPGSYGTATDPATYSLTVEVENVTITGEPGAKAPWIYLGGQSHGLSAGAQGDSVSWLNVAFTGAVNYNAIYLATGGHLFVTSDQQVGTCAILVQLVDSACVNTNAAGGALALGIGGYGTPTTEATAIRNVTAVSTSADTTAVYVDGGYDCTCSVAFTNDVMQGGLQDIEGYQQTTGTLTMTVAHSSYLKVDVIAPASLSDLGHNINKRASFVDLAKDNLRERPGSPTIDTGQRVAASDTDLADHPRTAGASTDMGAYEYLPPPRIGKISVASRHKRSMTIKAVVNPGALATTVQLVARRHGSRMRKSKLVSAGHGAAGHTVRLKVSKLRPGEKYTLTLVANSLGGKTKKTRHARTARP